MEKEPRERAPQPLYSLPDLRAKWGTPAAMTPNRERARSMRVPPSPHPSSSMGCGLGGESVGDGGRLIARSLWIWTTPQTMEVGCLRQSKASQTRSGPCESPPDPAMQPQPVLHPGSSHLSSPTPTHPRHTTHSPTHPHPCTVLPRRSADTQITPYVPILKTKRPKKENL